MKNAQASEGFTLIELIVVLILIGISAALVIPTVSPNIDRIQFKKDAHVVTSMLKLARTQAIASKTPSALTIDLDRRAIWLEDNIQPTRRFTSPKSTKLPNTDTMTLETQKRERRSGIEAIEFYPNGSSSGGIISMSGHGGKDAIQIQIQIHRMTGLTSSTFASRQ